MNTFSISFVGFISSRSLIILILDTLCLPYLVYLLYFLFIYFLNLFIYLILLLAALGLRRCAQAFSSCGELGLLFVVVRGLLIAVASPAVEHGLQVRGLQ